MEVAESVGMGHVAAALLVVVVAALMVRQAASQRQLRCIPIKGAVQGFLKIQHYNYWIYRESLSIFNKLTKPVSVRQHYSLNQSLRIYVNKPNCV